MLHLQYTLEIFHGACIAFLVYTLSPELAPSPPTPQPHETWAEANRRKKEEVRQKEAEAVRESERERERERAKKILGGTNMPLKPEGRRRRRRERERESECTFPGNKPGEHVHLALTPPQSPITNGGPQWPGGLNRLPCPGEEEERASDRESDRKSRLMLSGSSSSHGSPPTTELSYNSLGLKSKASACSCLCPPKPRNSQETTEKLTPKPETFFLFPPTEAKAAREKRKAEEAARPPGKKLGTFLARGFPMFCSLDSVGL